MERRLAPGCYPSIHLSAHGVDGGLRVGGAALNRRFPTIRRRVETSPGPPAHANTNRVFHERPVAGLLVVDARYSDRLRSIRYDLETNGEGPHGFRSNKAE